LAWTDSSQRETFDPLDEDGFLAALRMENEKMEWKKERAGKE